MSAIDVPDEKTSIPKLKRMNRMLDAVYRTVMQKGTDYDTLPGASKPILLKPGAELLARHFDLVADTKIVGSVEKLDQAVPYFEYDAECRLYNPKGEFVGNGVGSCNTGESQYRHVWVGEEDLPKDIKNLEELQTRDIGGNKQYRVPISREEAFGLANTVMKKASKRSFVDAILKVSAACYSSDTEVMTKAGWKPIPSITSEDEVMTRRDDGAIEFHHPTEKQECDWSGFMIQFGGTFRTRVDLLVTPNHNMLVRDWNSKILFKQAALLFEESVRRKGVDLHQKIVRTSAWIGEDLEFFEIPPARFHLKTLEAVDLHSRVMELYANGLVQAAICRETGVPSPIVSNWVTGKHDPHSRLNDAAPKRVQIGTMLRFLGWYLSEGSVGLDGVFISQSGQAHPQKVRTICAMVDEMGFAYRFADNQVHIYSAALRDYCKQFGHAHQKFIPATFKKLPAFRLRLLLESLLQGDGHISYRKGGLKYAKYTTVSKRLADDVQEIAIKAGYSSTICKAIRGPGQVMGRPVKQFRDVYDVTVVEQRDTTITRRSIRKVEYHGKVYCVTLPNHTLLVRRNGKYAWCGNSRIFTQDVGRKDDSGNGDGQAVGESAD